MQFEIDGEVYMLAELIEALWLESSDASVLALESLSPGSSFAIDLGASGVVLVTARALNAETPR